MIAVLLVVALVLLCAGLAIWLDQDKTDASS